MLIDYKYSMGELHSIKTKKNYEPLVDYKKFTQ